MSFPKQDTPLSCQWKALQLIGKAGKAGGPEADVSTAGSLELRVLSRRVPEMENFNHAFCLAIAVVDLERRMEKPSNSRITPHGRAKVRKVFQKIDVREKRVGELLAGARVPLPRPAHERLQLG